jgi:hypothetical protein
MARNLFISSFKRYLFVLKIVLLVMAVLSMESIINDFLDRYNTNKSFRVGRRIVKNIKNIAPADILIIGDSSCIGGITHRLISQSTGLNAVMRAVPARYAQMSGYYLLKDYVKTKPAPRIVLDIRTPSFFSTNWSPELFFDNFFNIKDCVEMISKGIVAPDVFLFDYLPNLFISYRNRFALKRIFGEKVSLLSGYQLNEAITEKVQDKKKRPIEIRKIAKPYKRTKSGVYVFKQDEASNTDWLEWMNRIDTSKEKPWVWGADLPNNFVSRSEKVLRYKVGQYAYVFKDIMYDSYTNPYQIALTYRLRLEFFNEVLKGGDNIITAIDRFYIEKMLDLCQRHHIAY